MKKKQTYSPLNK